MFCFAAPASALGSRLSLKSCRGKCRTFSSAFVTFKKKASLSRNQCLCKISCVAPSCLDVPPEASSGDRYFPRLRREGIIRREGDSLTASRAWLCGAPSGIDRASAQSIDRISVVPFLGGEGGAKRQERERVRGPSGGRSCPVEVSECRGGEERCSKGEEARARGLHLPPSIYRSSRSSPAVPGELLSFG